jgi:hypothetical protein
MERREFIQIRNSKFEIRNSFLPPLSSNDLFRLPDNHNADRLQFLLPGTEAAFDSSAAFTAGAATRAVLR